MNEFKKCTQCNRELPANKDYFFMKLGKLNNRCKECCGRHFTNHLTHIPKEGHVFCKKCDRELPHTYQYFPEDKSCKTGLRYVCRECDKSYGRFLNDGEEPNRAWSSDEIELLKKIYNEYTSLELKEKFFPNRTIRAIESQASVLKLCTGKTQQAKIRANNHKSEVLSEIFSGRKFTDEWKKKLSESKKEYYKTHEHYWKGRKRSKEQCIQISKRVKERGLWSGDKNPRHLNPLYGESNGRWKGGIMETYTELRSDTKDWMNKSMEFCDYKCVISGESFDNIHHTTSFKDIVKECFAITKLEIKEKVRDYQKEDFDSLRTVLKELHNLYGYGACVSKDIHKLFHDNYGYINFSPFDFLDFVHRIDDGEFDEWFTENNINVSINYKYMDYLENVLNNIK